MNHAGGCGFEGADSLTDPGGDAPDNTGSDSPEQTSYASADFDAEKKRWRGRLLEARNTQLDLNDPRSVLPETLAVYTIERPQSDAARAALEAAFRAQDEAAAKRRVSSPP